MLRRLLPLLGSKSAWVSSEAVEEFEKIGQSSFKPLGN